MCVFIDVVLCTYSCSKPERLSIGDGTEWDTCIGHQPYVMSTLSPLGNFIKSHSRAQNISASHISSKISLRLKETFSQFNPWNTRKNNAKYFPLQCSKQQCCNDKLSSGYFPGVWVFKADVSEHCVGSIFNRRWRWNRQCSETSAFSTQTPGKYPEDNLSLLQHGESFKTRII